jgi:hypothetical protein
MTAFRDNERCSIVLVDRRFRDVHCLHYQDADFGGSNQLLNVGVLPQDYIILFSRKLSLYTSRRENLKFHWYLHDFSQAFLVKRGILKCQSFPPMYLSVHHSLASYNYTLSSQKLFPFCGVFPDI